MTAMKKSGACVALRVSCLAAILLALSACTSTMDATDGGDLDGASEGANTDAFPGLGDAKGDAAKDASSDGTVDACANTMSDPANCGSCGHACPTGQLCSGGTCAATCGQGLATCTGDGGATRCVSTQSDNANCGACGQACGAGQVCSGGSCRTSCQPTETQCTPAGGSAYCANTSTDNANCGGCGQACTAGQVCSSGTCGLTCQAGLLNCGGTCTDPSNSRAFCGATGTCQGASAGTACAAGQVCSAGTCAVSCVGGQVNCGAACVDPRTTNQFCGASGTCQGANAGTVCAAGQVCSGGTCGLTCQSGLVNCGGTCIDPRTSRAFCGANGTCQAANAGTACAAGQVCSGGACGLTCQPGLVDCNGTCVDPTTSRQFCGATGACMGASGGTVCASGQVCTSGACSVSCPAGEINCGGACVDWTTNNAFCGASGNCSGANAGTTCQTGRVCAGGMCGLTCQSGLLNCASVCTDPKTDRTHCGASGSCTGGTIGSVCAAGQLCTGGTCNLSCQAGEFVTNGRCCPSGQFFCGGVCVDPRVNTQNCGIHADCSAGVACGAGLVCSGSACAATCAAPLVLNAAACVDSTSITTCGATTMSLGTDCTTTGRICTASGGVSACACPAGESATNNQCCPTGQFFCGGKCIDPTVDSNNCGIHADCSAGVACGGGQVCSTSGGVTSCAATCAAPLVLNSGACVDSTSTTTCGATTVSLGTNCTTTGQICTTSGGVSACACPAGESATNSQCCPTGQFFCGGKCIDPTVDSNNCGIHADCSAGVACGGGQVCSTGGGVTSCAATCAAPLVLNTGACVDSTSITTCGATTVSLGTNCTATGRICTTSGGVSACACPVGESATNNQCCPTGQFFCSGKCVDPTVDSTHCGIHADCSAGVACGGGQVCSTSGGVTSCAATCAAPLVLNGGACVDSTSITTCGATTVSLGTNCTTSGRICTTSGGVSACACPVGESATNNACCPTGQFFCGGNCIDPTVDSNNCGIHSDCTAGIACGGGQVCSTSGGVTSCAATCAAPLVLNGGACVDSTSITTCGATTVSLGTNCVTTGQICTTSGGVSACACPPGESATNNQCCPTGQFFCTGKCVDPTVDSTHCGIHADCSAGIACGGGQVCSTSGGVTSCAATCAAPLVLNGGVCVDSTSITTCGATTVSLGTNCMTTGQICTTSGGVSACACPTGEGLSNGLCCPTGQINCSSACIDPNSTPGHCGATAGCGAAGGAVGAICTAAQACVGGSCLALATKTVFVTSTTYDGLTIASIAHANALCQGRATAAGLLGTYNAFLSDEVNSAAANLTHATVPYTLVNGTIVANNWAGLTSNSLIAAINLTEFGAAVPAGALCGGTTANVYTGSFPNGTPIHGFTCLSWSSNSPTDQAAAGDSTRTDVGWVALCPTNCDVLGALYCLEQ